MIKTQNYILIKQLLLRERTAELLNVPNRIYQEGEEMALPDNLAKPLLDKGTIVLKPEPEPVQKPVKKPAKKAVIKEAK